MQTKQIIYLTFFLSHIPVMFLIDLYPFYPASIRPGLLDTLREFYISTYRDRFFVSPPTWFKSYLAMEAAYHVPLSIWMVYALFTENELVPLHLLVFALQAGLTTWTCLADIYGDDAGYYTAAEKANLYVPYGAYLAFAIFAGVDSFLVLRKSLLQRSSEDKQKTG